ncbi:hypothetical protein BH11PLA1_BH11PLA1_13550 [soil metagenome]
MTRVEPGLVRDAIVASLQAGREAAVREIHSDVERRLGGAVPPSSVRSYLRLNAQKRFIKTRRGHYSLADANVAPTAGMQPSLIRTVWTGKHSRLDQGDCFGWLAQQPANSLHAIVTDPPYGVVEYSDEQQAKLRSGRGGVWRIPPAFDGHVRAPLPRFTTLRTADFAEIEAFFYRFAVAAFPVLVPGAHVMVASNPLLSYLVANQLARAGFERRGEIIRLVMTMRGGDRPKNAHEEFSGVSVMPRSMWEPWLLFRKPLEGRVQDNLRRWGTGGLRRISGAQPFGDVIRSSPTQPRERAIAPHPSLKPQAFMRQLVRAALPLGTGTILDPFAGAGSTLAACEALGMNGIGVERDETYAAVAARAIPRLAALQSEGGSLYSHP